MQTHFEETAPRSVDAWQPHSKKVWKRFAPVKPNPKAFGTNLCSNKSTGQPSSWDADLCARWFSLKEDTKPPIEPLYPLTASCVHSVLKLMAAELRVC